MPGSPTDEKRAQTSQIFRLDGKGIRKQFNDNLWNGRYQQILWLGVSGFVVINHEDKEILLVDPWPTECSKWIGKIPLVKDRPLRNTSARAKKRIQSLASFLRKSHKADYKLSAILLSHMHFDHADDVSLLIELLAAPKGTYKSRRKHDFKIAGTPVPVKNLPVICADFDTLLYLKSIYFDLHWISAFAVNEPDKVKKDYFKGQQELAEMIGNLKPATNPTWEKVKKRYSITAHTDPWHEITWDQWSMFHDDVFNHKVLKGNLASRRREPGTTADAFTIPGSVFEFQPYVWDHMKTPVFTRPLKDSIDGQSSGHYQRITAFMVKRKGTVNAKRTFFAGSAGEMGGKFTRPRPPADMATIETDVLVQAIQTDDLKGVPDPYLDEMMAQSRRFTLSKIAVKDCVVFSHFEEFVRKVAGQTLFEDNYKAAAGDTIKGYKALIKKNKCLPANEDLITNKRLFVLKRYGFNNFELPESAAKLV